MKMICDVPDEVIKSVRMGTWLGSSVAEKMIAKGIPLDELRAEITMLQNRCYALTKGTMCAFCKFECEYKTETEEEDG